MIKVFAFLVFVFFLTSCSSLDFTYKDSSELENPIYNKTKVSLSGKELISINKEFTNILGNGQKTEYELFINIDESKTRRSVQNNQAVAKVDYKLNFKYKLYSIKNKCFVYEEEIISRFSYVPKSAGFNFGSDKSLDKKYDLASKNNLKNFVELLSSKDVFTCLNEG